MKLGSLKQGGRDGSLIVVSRDLSKAIHVDYIVKTLQEAIEDWDKYAPLLEDTYKKLNAGTVDQGKVLNFNELDLASPLPRSYQWADGSAYLNHVELVRKARGAEMPPSFLEDPLMYQGGSDVFIGPNDPIYIENEEWGIDFEGEVAVITDDVPMGCPEDDAYSHIKLVMLCNDVSLRGLIPNEISKGFGFFHGKPASSFSPVAVTADELGEAWNDAKVHLPLNVTYNDKIFGQANAGQDMQFNFAQLIAHASKSRYLSAGTIIGSGTVSNFDMSIGHSCLAEARMVEKIKEGVIKTSFMSFGDKIKIEMLDANGQSIFGSIDQAVKPYQYVKKEVRKTG